MALQGTIDAFPVVDVLQLLAGSRKTGRLIVEGDRSTAQLFVADGSATGGGVQGVDGSALVDVVAELLRYREGSFLFEPGSEAPQPQDPEDLPALVDAAGERMAAWAAIEAVVPATAIAGTRYAGPVMATVCAEIISAEKRLRIRSEGVQSREMPSIVA